jgi:hypothetical protein
MSPFYSHKLLVFQIQQKKRNFPFLLMKNRHFSLFYPTKLLGLDLSMSPFLIIKEKKESYGSIPKKRDWRRFWEIA